ncbi:chaperonin 10-like protein [Hyaloraphidium curvatum]|nr:chaperonin 10-like protein [Hyaloraphidium curvatum]
MKAVVLPKKGGPFEIGTHAKPTPGKGELLVKTVASALNPVDWKIGKFGAFNPKYPAVLGCDVSGIVEAAPEGSSFMKGDEVLSFVRIAAPGYGSFGEYTLTVEGATVKKPKNLTHVQAAAVPLGLITAAWALFQDLGIPLPSDKSSPRPSSILIWGASSSIGSFAVQLARLTGIKKIVAVCGAKNVGLVEKLGATDVISHTGQSVDAVAAKVKAAVGSDLHHSFDAVSPATAAACVACMNPSNSTISCAAGPPSPKPAAGITVRNTASMGIFSPKKAAWAHDAWLEFADLLGSGKLAVSPGVIEVKGYEGILEGLKKLEKGDVSGEKIVAVLDEARAKL